ncbi:hypothetical protein OIU34_22490 [Pararhizobium sp. BT-229]|uniref:hypothetical protein n=1 Tax=Pararhizobium sp. BT-229 TaxID=2986923 RepID=UPI0021F6F79F|nr:hypothetical protein [Pararhizobium sp. BT-229]MCV9964664.1 hypothetical protein [Pararhizobium sp. BT-229]
MASVQAHLKSFIAEVSVAGLSALIMYAAIVVAARKLGVFNPATDLLAVTFVFPFAAVVLMFKTVFPRTVRHRSYSLVTYLLLAQLLAGLFCAVLLEAMGECLDCSGNIHDVVFYGIAAGTPYGLLYAFFSKIFSVDVDTPGRGV